MKSLEYQISGLNKNLTNGSSYAHVIDDQPEMKDSAGSLMRSSINIFTAQLVLK